MIIAVSENDIIRKKKTSYIKGVKGTDYPRIGRNDHICFILKFKPRRNKNKHLFVNNNIFYLY